MFYTYILLSEKDGRTYTGFCSDLEERLKKHNRGDVVATRNRRPFRILFTEELENMEQAKKREKYWKSGAGRRKLKKMFENNNLPL